MYRTGPASSPGDLQQPCSPLGGTRVTVRAEGKESISPAAELPLALCQGLPERRTATVFGGEQ